MIHLLFTGGTISMQRDERAGGNVPVHGGEALVGFAPELRLISRFRIEDWGRYPACHMGPAKLWELRNRVEAVARGDGTPAQERPRGIVITHGTDTIEETAYLLARTLDPAIPVAITGAMRTSSDEAWDGPRNLTDAARVAAAPESAGRGTMVVFAGKIFSGLQAVKTDTVALEAFSAPHAAPVGVVKGETIQYFEPPACPPATGRESFRARPPADLTARVALIPMVIGDQGQLLDLARPLHDGVVVVAFGSGNIPPGAVPAVGRWIAEGKPVVLASRCLSGQVTATYAFPGGGATLIRAGVLPAGPRTPSQARMELSIAISAGRIYGDQ